MTIAPRGPVTVGVLRELLLQLLVTLAPGRRVTVAFGGAAEFDVAFVELLGDSRSFALRLGAGGEPAEPVPDRLLAIPDQGGFAAWPRPHAGTSDEDDPQGR